MRWLKGALMLMALQAVAAGLLYFLYPDPWLARLCGLLFLAGVWSLAAAELRPVSRVQRWAAALLFQLPGLISSVLIGLELTGLVKHTSLGDIFDFLMQTWHTPLLPWLTLLPHREVANATGEPLVLFFLALPLLSLLLVGWVLLASGLTKRRLPG
jgi:hypothetical protein